MLNNMQECNNIQKYTHKLLCEIKKKKKKATETNL